MASKTSGRSSAARIPPPPAWRRVLLASLEILALISAGLIATVAVLGRAAEAFGGSALTGSLLPFTATVLALVLGGSLLIGAGVVLRRRLPPWSRRLPVLLIFASALAFAVSDRFAQDSANLRILVGGSEAAARTGIAHQVYANYRRTDLAQLQRVLERSRPFLPIIRRAAAAHGVDPEVLVGVGATESSFLPRDSKDGGRGLFQITAPPRPAVEAARRQVDSARLDPRNPEHNAHLAAATLNHYLKVMDGDLFLGLLAYNIGPRNGGLQSIMKQYGARDFFTIKPYLQSLPGDYPIRVLTAALAFRLIRTDGRLPRYEEADNARRIQRIGIPGLDGEGLTDPVR